ncbi:MAG: flavin prenyltransferase UbiX [Thiohalomonadales bacterium]
MSYNTSKESITIAITGASGIQYGVRLLEQVLKSGCKVHFMISSAAHVVAKIETEWDIPSHTDKIQAYFSDLFQTNPALLQVYSKEQWTASIASGSNVPRAMVICPCTSATLAAISAGLSDNLIERAADVILKEKKRLILVTRETPLSGIHLQNMLNLHQAGATIMPASPGFYYKPEQIEDLITFMVARILDHLAISHQLLPRWGEDNE